MTIKKIGQCIKENRERKGLTTLQLAQLLKTDIVSVQSYEKGEKKTNSKRIGSDFKCFGYSVDSFASRRWRG